MRPMVGEGVALHVFHQPCDVNRGTVDAEGLRVALEERHRRALGDLEGLGEVGFGGLGVDADAVEGGAG